MTLTALFALFNVRLVSVSKTVISWHFRIIQLEVEKKPQHDSSLHLVSFNQMDYIKCMRTHIASGPRHKNKLPNVIDVLNVVNVSNVMHVFFFRTQINVKFFFFYVDMCFEFVLMDTYDSHLTGISHECHQANQSSQQHNSTAAGDSQYAQYTSVRKGMVLVTQTWVRHVHKGVRAQRTSRMAAEQSSVPRTRHLTHSLSSLTSHETTPMRKSDDPCRARPRQQASLHHSGNCFLLAASSRIRRVKTNPQHSESLKTIRTKWLPGTQDQPPQSPSEDGATDACDTGDTTTSVKPRDQFSSPPTEQARAPWRGVAEIGVHPHHYPAVRATVRSTLMTSLKQSWRDPVWIRWCITADLRSGRRHQEAWCPMCEGASVARCQWYNRACSTQLETIKTLHTASRQEVVSGVSRRGAGVPAAGDTLV